MHNKCIFKDLGVNDFSEIGSKYTPNELVAKLYELGFSKDFTFKSSNSGQATIMSSSEYKMTFRIQATPSNGRAYFRVQNMFGNYLMGNGKIPSDFGKKIVGELTHFYFIGG